MTNKNERRKIPELRFPEFSGEWEEIQFNKIFFDINRKSGDTKKFPLYSLTVENGITPKTDRFNREFLVKKNDNYKLVSFGNIIYNPMNITLGAIDKSNIEKDILVSGYYNVMGIKDNFDINFLSEYLKSNKMINHYKKISTGSLTEKQRVHFSEFIKIKRNFPRYDEQQKIGEFFSMLNRQIELEEKKLALLEEQKKGYMQKIFSQELRFKDENGEEYPEWEITKLSDLYYKGKAGGTPKSNESRYYNGNINFLSVKDITTQGMYIGNTEKTITEAGLENSSAWIVPVNSICYSMYASVGFLSINKIPLATSQAIFSMIFKDIELTKYIYYYLLYFQSLGEIEKLVGTGTQSNLSSKIMANIEILVPINDEYIKINSLMDKYYKKIELSKNKINLLKQRILYLNNNLFI